MRILVTLLLDTLPMLGNVLLLCFFVFFIFGIIGVQLWSGLLRQRCYIQLPANMTRPSYVPAYYRLPNSDKEYLCSTYKDAGLHRCQDLPQLRSFDMSTVCQNSLDLSWKAPEPIGYVWTQQQVGNSNQSVSVAVPQYEQKYIDGEPVPYDLVPGDESSPFLVKQMSPLIAQSVFQPARRRRRRRRRSLEASDSSLASESRSSLRASHQQQQQQLPPPPPPHTTVRKRRRTRAASAQPPEAAPTNNHTSRQVHSSGDVSERIRRARLYSDEPNNAPEPIVETNANSDLFERVSQVTSSSSSSLASSHNGRKLTTSARRTKGRAAKGACINWNKYYTECRAGDVNPFQGTISFDNVGMAWTTIFLVISLEGWSDIMYLLQDSHSFWVWIYFVLLIVIGSFFMINLCLVVIATQFSATKKREMERMRQERMKFSSSSTLTAGSESANCYTVIVKLIARGLRRAKLALLRHLKRRKCTRLRRQAKEAREAATARRELERQQQQQITGAISVNREDEDNSNAEKDITEDNVDISFCPACVRRNECIQRNWRQCNDSIRRLVDHNYFQRLILLAILINAISMGIEYHNQPEQLTEAVEISNILFACLFLVEMILKLIAHGVYAYVIDGFNCFDGCIVIISILELFESSSGSGLSVLRTFRLLRILKLVRFMPALRRQLVIMLRTLDNVAVFFALLVLFIFIFSILGMNLFGCKFCETLPDGTERCDRKNFNSLLWSLVTVFQILTQEDWNVSRCC